MKKVWIAFLAVSLILLTACGATEHTTTPSTTEQAKAEAPQADMQKASAAYAAFLGQFSAFSSESLYVEDINADGYPEIIARPAVLEDGELYCVAMQFMATYTDKVGLSVIYPNAHSSMGVNFRVSADNCLYYTDDGHNMGTAAYHTGYVYSVDDLGFRLMGQAFGDDWPEIADYNDYELIGRMDEEYDQIFADKIRAITGERVFTECGEIDLPDDADAYLNDALGIDITAARQSYADAQERLQQAAASAAGREPQSVFVSDYDRDGIYEAFAFVAEDKLDNGLATGSVWFVNAQGEARLIQTDVAAIDPLGTLSCTYHDYFQAPLVGGSSAPTSLWVVKDGACSQVGLFDKAQTDLEIITTCYSEYIRPDTLISSLSAFDMSFSDAQVFEETGEPYGVGHTHKAYFFRDTPEGIKEFGGLEVQKSDIERIAGGKELIDLAQKDGRTIESIYYRENGVVSFSVSERSEGETDYYCFNALYAENKLFLLYTEGMYCLSDFSDVKEDDYLGAGFYAAAASQQYATFPETFG